jgi:asparagine synthase (glutamine-hydrolysing)
MRSDLRPFLEDTLSPASIAKSGYFSAGPINSLWRAFTSGRNDADWSRIWSLAVLIDFINRGRGAFRPPAAIQARRA